MSVHDNHHHFGDLADLSETTTRTDDDLFKKV